MFWINLAQDRDVGSCEHVNELSCARIFLTHRHTSSFSGRTLLHEVGWLGGLLH